MFQSTDNLFGETMALDHSRHSVWRPSSGCPLARP